MLTAHIPTREELHDLLCAPLDTGHTWSLQGLGMLRTYLTEDKSVRLHVWSSQYRFEDVSELHTHPWDMKSTVLAGEIKQVRYLRNPDAYLAELPPTHMEQKILCGEGGGPCSVPQPVFLVAQRPEWYYEGESYEQRWDEIHSSHPFDGTVTLVERKFTSDPDHAFVYWPHGTEWVTAEPRPATDAEVFDICGRALRLWFQ